MNTNFLQLYLYSIKQQINNILIHQLNEISVFSFLILFIGGLLTSINPCMLSSLPFTIIYIKEKQKRFTDIFLLLIGISTSLFAIGISGLLLKEKYWYLFNSIPFIWSIFIILLGCNLLNILNFSVTPSKTFKLLHFTDNRSLKAYITGINIGIGISPCSTPILITLIIWISSTEQFIIGFTCLTIYIIGYIFPLTLTIFYFQIFMNNNFINHIWDHISKIIGCLTISIGSFLLSHEIFLLA
uniref:Thiol:disulfi de interchange protein n=1 Tax=Dichotomaria marginata TaxID=268567 RepID=A0A1G4NS64_9FLOR|nr:Thiol:disulfi de interchange protein [Dichotomaria marginata]SCW21455.1 Thiol:disulfi de interchange protein [Dichotomaria marginata]